MVTINREDHMNAIETSTQLPGLEGVRAAEVRLHAGPRVISLGGDGSAVSNPRPVGAQQRKCKAHRHPVPLTLEEQGMVVAWGHARCFDADRLLSSVFVSPWFRKIVVAEPSDTMLPLYRHCVHPRIPQMAVVGYAESAASMYPYEMMAKWVAHLLGGAVRLPSVAAMERSVAEWERWGRWAKRRSGAFFLKSCIATATTWYHDKLCRDMGHNPRRKLGEGFLADWLQPYGSTDYAGIQSSPVK